MNVPTNIIIVGLGPGNPDQITGGALRTLQQAGTIWLRTSKHPCIPFLPAGIKLESFDDYYDRLDSFEAVYVAIVDKLLELALQDEKPVVYAVPGHPLVVESSVTKLL